MFNLNTALEVGFSSLLTPAQVSVEFINDGAANFVKFGGAIAAFFNVVTAGSSSTTTLLVGRHSSDVSTPLNLVESFGDELLIIPGLNNGQAAGQVIDCVTLINNIPTEGEGSQPVARGGQSNYTAPFLTRNCVASIDPTNSNILLITQLVPSVTSLAITQEFNNANGEIISTGGTPSQTPIFSDNRINLASFSDNRIVTPASNETALIIKYTKALNAIFVYVTNPNSGNDAIIQMTATKPNGDTIPFTDFVDGTQGLSQSGFVYWQPERDKYESFTAGEEFTYEFIFSAPIAATFGGINLLFCDKFDLLREYPDLDNLLGIADEKTITPQLIRFMESTMLEIEKKVQNSPFWKEDRQYFFTAKELDRWDLLQINEINQAAIFWTLAKILYFLSDTPGDIYSVKAADYRARGESAFESVNLSLDFNDNGSLDVFEGEREAANIEITFER